MKSLLKKIRDCLIYLRFVFIFIISKIFSLFTRGDKIANFLFDRIFTQYEKDYIFLGPLKFKTFGNRVFVNIKNQNKNVKRIDEDSKKIANSLRNEGYCAVEKSYYSGEEASNVINYFSSELFYLFHIPIKGKEANGINFNEWEKNNKDHSYVSYDLKTQLNCPHIMKACLDDKIVNIARDYLECEPTLFSVNTFWTFPNEETSFTHGFHRDIDDFKYIVFFIFWTPTDQGNGSLEYIPFTHIPNQSLSKTFKEEGTSDFMEVDKSWSDYELFDQFQLNSMPGYGNDHYFEKIFGEKIVSFNGPPGVLNVMDNFGLHRGTPVTDKRLVTWIRFGVSNGRNSLAGISQRELKEESLKVFKNSSNKEILARLVN